MANTAYFAMMNPLKSRAIHLENKICICKTIICPILCYQCETWTMSSKSEEMLDAFKRKILRWVYSPTKDDTGWRIRYNTEIYDLYTDMKVTAFIIFRGLQWAGHVIRI